MMGSGAGLKTGLTENQSPFLTPAPRMHNLPRTLELNTALKGCVPDKLEEISWKVEGQQ